MITYNFDTICFVDNVFLDLNYFTCIYLCSSSILNSNLFVTLMPILELLIILFKVVAILVKAFTWWYNFVIFDVRVLNAKIWVILSIKCEHPRRYVRSMYMLFDRMCFKLCFKCLWLLFSCTPSILVLNFWFLCFIKWELLKNLFIASFILPALWPGPSNPVSLLTASIHCAAFNLILNKLAW